MAIGQISLGSGLRQQSPLAQTSQAQSPLDTRSEQLGREMPLMSRSDYEPVKAGFGNGTVSVPTEALHALGRNMKSVRNLLPSSEEAREKIQERISELQQSGLNTPRIESAESAQPRPMAGRNALTLMNEMNDATKLAREAVGGTEATSPEARPSVLAGDETIATHRSLSHTFLDVLA
jgi:hypothetical protein